MAADPEIACERAMAGRPRPSGHGDSFVTQSILTIVADVEPAGLDALREDLVRMHDDPAGNEVFPLGRLETLHFASVVLADRLDPPKIIFENNVDGTVDEWLQQLVAGGAHGLDSLFSASPGYPGSDDPGRLRSWLKEHVVLPSAFHIGAVGRTRERISRELKLHDAIEAYIDDEAAAGRLACTEPDALRSRIQRVIAADTGLEWAQDEPGPRETRREHLVHQARYVAVAPVLVLLSPLLVVVVAALALKERFDKAQSGAPDPAHVARLEQDEDLIAQNHFSSVIAVKPGRLRALTLRGVLKVVNLKARATETHGKLGGIPSIHFAHWCLIDDGRHLVFLSNFDGSWENYLGDFIDKAAGYLSAVWSNTVEFPRTFLLVRGGAADGPRFRQWARAHQCPSAVWYSAYPTTTMPIIDNNSSLREGLFADPKEGTAAWLRRL